MSATVELAAALAARGHAVSLISFDAPGAAFLKDTPAGLTVFALGPAYSSYGFLPGLRRKLGRLPAFDVIVLNGLWLHSTYGVARWAQKNNVPYVLFPHGMLDPYFHRFPLKYLKKLVYWNLFERHTARHAAALAYTTPSELALAQRAFPHFSPTHQEVVGLGLRSCGVPLSAAKAAFWERFPALKEKPFILYLSRFDEKKAPDLLLRALKEFPALHLVMAGPPEGSAYYKTLQVLAPAGQVTWTGMITGPLKWGVFAAAQGLVLPSHQENFGMVVAEALSVGTPVLVSDQVALATDVMRYRCGFVEHDTLPGVRSLLRQFTQLTPDDMPSLRERALLCYKDNYQPSTVAARMEALLEKMKK